MSTYGVKLERSAPLRLPPRDDACSEDTFETWCKARTDGGARLAVDLFSGAGGLSLGLTQAGWTVAVAADHDPWALHTHRANFSGLTLDVDLGDKSQRDRLVRMLKRTDIDLIAGGPPCQPFSRAGRSKIRSLVDAGKREPVDDRRELWRAFVDVVTRVRPRAVLMENVPDMALGDDLYVVRIIVDTLETAGYQTQVTLADAWKYGVPQHRQRLIVLGRRDTDEFSWPDTASTETSVRHAIHDLPRLGLTTGNRTMEYGGRPTSDFAVRMRRDAERGVIHDHVTRPVRDDDREIFALMDSKMLYAQVPERLRRYKVETFDDKYKRLGWDDRSRSITAHIAKDGYWYIHPEEHRTLTVREAARIQTFPDWFRFGGHRSDAFRQIGNAVPPALGEAAARAVVPSPSAAATNGGQAVRHWRRVQSALTRWARRERRGDRWYLLPGADVTPAVAALTAMTRATPAVAEAMAPLRGMTTIPAAHVANLAAALHTRATNTALTRLQDVGLPGAAWRDEVAVEQACQFRPAERDMYWLLRDTDMLLKSQAATRVAARVCGTESETRNRLSNGRLDMARLVGAGNDAPLRMAALHLIGSTLCRPQGSLCGKCPLRDVCTSGDPSVAMTAGQA